MDKSKISRKARKNLIEALQKLKIKINELLSELGEEENDGWLQHVCSERSLWTNSDKKPGQRVLSSNQVKKVAANFDVYQINPVKVSRRNGINYVFNGQHTIETVALVSGSRETPVWCMIYDDLDYEREADIFANQQKYVKPLKAYEVYIAHIEAGSDKQLLIRDVVESYVLQIGKTRAPGTITCV